MHRLHKNNFKLNVKTIRAVVVVKRWRFLLYACVCMRVKAEKSYYFQMCYAIKCRNIAFKGIFSPVGHFSLLWWIVVRVG